MADRDPSRDSILSADDVQVEPVAVPEWPCDVYVRVMSGVARDEFEQACTDHSQRGRADVRGLRALLVTLTACDSAGALLFLADDADALNTRSSGALERICQAARKLNRLTDEDIEDAAKNSGSGPSAASGSS